MQQITWVSKNELTAAAMAAMEPTEVLLDIGCGIVPQNYVRPLVHICCEPYAEYVATLQDKISTMASRDRSYVVLNMGWDGAVRYFPEKSVDTVILVDVIEHLEKEEGRALLRQTEKLARQQVIIFTPLGFMPQHHADGKDAWGLSGADWQEHKSGWLPEDFEGEDWRFFAAREFHTVDSLNQPLEKAYGAFWAIKTCQGGQRAQLADREKVLQKWEADIRQQQLMMQQELNSLFLGRIERKIRRWFSQK